MLKRVRTVVLTGALTLGAMGVIAQPAHADEPNCWSNRDWTYNWSAYSVCTNRAHRIIISCNTATGTQYAYGPWANPNQRSQAWCPGNTKSINYYGADYPD
ncbi:hypothetical protein ACNTMW_07860 [Planosporangium sp. 12N6]|uniref:hypothetical protein n=1 Tax=Planosporangium spinosum TaxID=3402278 RepID=UPI003CEEFE00